MTAVRPYADSDRLAWEDYVRESPSATCYHQIGWKRVIESSFRTKTFYLLSENSRTGIDGVLPLALLSSVPFGRFMVSLPYFNYGGICASAEHVRSELLRRAVEIARMQGAAHLEVRESAPPTDGLAVKTTKVAMRLALPSSAQALWTSFSSDIRRKVRRPQKEGLEARVEKAEALDAFYRVFAVNMRDLGTPVYPKSFFANVLREFPESTWICTVYRDSAPLAAGLLIGFRDTLEIPWVSSLRAYNHLYTNMLLYWTALSFACEHGYRVFDFGRSTMGGGTYRFKLQWGAVPTQLYWHYWLQREGAVPELNPDNPRYAMAIRVWQKLPVRLTTLIGPSIVRNLP
ncbi:MAG TPA: FemAB family XrtA/PEP-CTERM system-associated protein [Vicinamibacterales bacterium]|nr:FemAB family XrtA/PEP-CTERM system-associated protein [Vicinamibacterales bacterium]